jgi:hypothetical protein
VDSLKVLDPKRPIREGDIAGRCRRGGKAEITEVLWAVDKCARRLAGARRSVIIAPRIIAR